MADKLESSLGAKRRPSLRTIAEAVGVSRMTVSRALRNDAALSGTTRRRVQEIARELGFIPDPKLVEFMAYVRRSAHSHKQETIAFVDVHPQLHQPRTQTELRIAEGVRRRAEALGYKLDFFTLGPEGLSCKRLIQILRARYIRGLVLQATRAEAADSLMLAQHFACGVVGALRSDLPLHAATPHHPHHLGFAMHELRRRGHRKIGFYFQRISDANMEHAWHSAFLYESLQRDGSVPLEAALLVEEYERDDFLAWYRRHEFDAVISNHLGTIDWLREDGHEVPNAVGFLHLDWSPDLNGVTGVDQCIEESGLEAVDLVVNQIHHNEIGVPDRQKIVMVRSSVWREGGTTRPLPKADHKPLARV